VAQSRWTNLLPIPFLRSSSSPNATAESAGEKVWSSFVSSLCHYDQHSFGDKQSLADMWVDFLLEEANKPEARAATTASTVTPTTTTTSTTTATI